jgi:hypothetical protein
MVKLKIGFINVSLCGFHYFQTERSVEHIIYIVEG